MRWREVQEITQRDGMNGQIGELEMLIWGESWSYRPGKLG